MSDLVSFIYGGKNHDTLQSRSLLYYCACCNSICLYPFGQRACGHGIGGSSANPNCGTHKYASTYSHNYGHVNINSHTNANSHAYHNAYTNPHTRTDRDANCDTKPYGDARSKLATF